MALSWQQSLHPPASPKLVWQTCLSLESAPELCSSCSFCGGAPQMNTTPTSTMANPQRKLLSGLLTPGEINRDMWTVPILFGGLHICACLVLLHFHIACSQLLVWDTQPAFICSQALLISTVYAVSSLLMLLWPTPLQAAGIQWPAPHLVYEHGHHVHLHVDSNPATAI